MQWIRSIYSSACLLFLFLFPQIQKSWHDYEHRHDTHCDAKAETHLHTLEHVCDFCDFAIALGIHNSVSCYDAFLQSIEYFCSPGVSGVFQPDYFSTLPSRAPPFQISC